MSNNLILGLDEQESLALEEMISAVESFSRDVSQKIAFYLDIGIIIGNPKKIKDVDSGLKIIYELFRTKSFEQNYNEAILVAIGKILEGIKYGMKEEKFIEEVMEFLFILPVKNKDKFIDMLEERLNRQVVHLFREEDDSREKLAKTG